MFIMRVNSEEGFTCHKRVQYVMDVYQPKFDFDLKSKSYSVGENFKLSIATKGFNKISNVYVLRFNACEINFETQTTKD